MTPVGQHFYPQRDTLTLKLALINKLKILGKHVLIFKSNSSLFFYLLLKKQNKRVACFAKVEIASFHLQIKEAPIRHTNK